MTAKVKLNTANRKTVQLSAQMVGGVEKQCQPFSKYQNVACSFNGMDAAMDGVFFIDLENIADLTPEEMVSKSWNIKIKDTESDKTELIVKDIQLIDDVNNKTYGGYVQSPVVLDGSSTTVTITPNDVVDNSTTVYYYGQASQYNIHYKVGNGSWTNVPGVSMESSSEEEGYNFKYVIDLGEAENTTVCFNDGNGNWDSKNGSNYLLSKGVYGIKNQEITKLSDIGEFKLLSFETDKVSPQIVGSVIKLTAETEGGIGEVKYRFSYVTNDNVETILRDYSTSSEFNWTPTEAIKGAIVVEAIDRKSVV